MKKLLLGLLTASVFAIIPSVAFAEEINESPEPEDVQEWTDEEIERTYFSLTIPYSFSTPIHVYALPDDFTPDGSWNKDWTKSIQYTDMGEYEKEGELTFIPGYYQVSDEYRNNLLVHVTDNVSVEIKGEFYEMDILEASSMYWEDPILRIAFVDEDDNIINDNVEFIVTQNGAEKPLLKENYYAYADDDTIIETDDVMYMSLFDYGEVTIHVTKVPEPYTIPDDIKITLAEQEDTSLPSSGIRKIKLEKEVIQETVEEEVDKTPAKIIPVSEKTVTPAASQAKSVQAAPTGDYNFLYIPMIVSVGVLLSVVVVMKKKKG